MDLIAMQSVMVTCEDAPTAAPRSSKRAFQILIRECVWVGPRVGLRGHRSRLLTPPPRVDARRPVTETARAERLPVRPTPE